MLKAVVFCDYVSVIKWFVMSHTKLCHCAYADFSIHQTAVGHDHKEKVAAHASVLDTKKGFGGKFGVQTDRVDKVRR